MRGSYYRQDPYWSEARYNGTCSKEGCSDQIHKGDRVFVYPRYRGTPATVYVGSCADAASRDFASMRADEDFMSGGY